MKKQIGGILAATFIASTLGLPINANAAELDVPTGERISAINEEAQQQIANEADEYLSQLIVQNRYTTATRIVWVYGCADKS